MSRENLKEETLNTLKAHGKSAEDIVWVGCREFKIPIDLFWELADKYYDSGYGGQEVATDLIVVGKDWWLERHEYDGSEWWEFKAPPTEPKQTIKVNRLMPGIWSDLLDINSFRVCSECGNVMSSGYCVFDGEEYYCSDKCLHKHHSKEEYDKMYKNDEAYWTEWC